MENQEREKMRERVGGTLMSEDFGDYGHGLDIIHEFFTNNSVPYLI